MPSWNIHIAHVERILDSEPLEELGIADSNTFLFGNVVPDIYVGYVVQPVTHKIPYKDTHFADPTFVPTPDASMFYRKYVQGKSADDLTLGAWTHLICDHYYNLRTNEYIARVGVQPGEETRIRKQSDFDMYGRTLDISKAPVLSDRIVRQCAEFAQYPIYESDVVETVRTTGEIVRKNVEDHVDSVPEYSLLTAEFFQRTFCEVDGVLREALHLYASGGDPSEIGRAQP